MATTTSTDTELWTYRGNCHCAAFVYEAQLPEIKSALECKCSICYKKGYLWAITEPAKFNIVKGSSDTLSRYTVESVVHRFCPKCATPVMAEFVEEGKLGLNVRAMQQDIDTWTLERQPFDCATVGGKHDFVPPEHKGPLPAAIDGHKLYIGSCHCGQVTLAFMSKPLDETFDDHMVDCNCSICVRNGYRWVYPPKEQVVLYASDPSRIGKYSFARHVLNKTFCTDCGVCLTNQHAHRTDEELQALGALPNPENFAERMKPLHPVNLRIFPDVDLSKMPEPTYGNGADRIKPGYVNP